MKLFWFLFFGFFVYLFPFLFSPLAEVMTPQFPILVLSLTLLLWIIYLVSLIRTFVIRPQKYYQETLALQQIEETIPAQIISKRVIREMNGEESLQLLLRFKNYSQSDIELTYFIIDSNTSLNRFEEGKTLNIKLNSSDDGLPLVIADGKMSSTHSPLLAWIFILFNVAYIIFSFLYWKNRVNYGFEFMSFSHPYFVNALTAVFLLFVLLKSVFTSGQKTVNNKLISYGRKVEAALLSAEQTGFYLNNQPQLRIELEFEDGNNNLIKVNKKQIVPLTILHRFDDSSIEILYDPQDPENLMFTSELK